MQEFTNKVAVVTGAASGIGRALAEAFAAQQMKVVLADIEEPALRDTEAAMKAAGATVLAVQTDVSKAADIQALASKTLEAFGAVHILCNNAGVAAPPGPLWERPLSDWEWVLGVNLWSVIYGIRTFMPILLKQGTEAHIVNTASVAGLLCGPFMGTYTTSKHGVVAISETLHVELAMAGAAVKVSVLCPGFVQTRIGEAERNRPRDSSVEQAGAVNMQTAEHIRAMLATGLPPAFVAARVLDAIRDEKLYILTHPEYHEAIRMHAESLIHESNPVYK